MPKQKVIKFYLKDQYEEALDVIKWASEYFIKCHVSAFEFYGQVGDFDIDHRFWGRPEELNMTRPAYKIDINKPGIYITLRGIINIFRIFLFFRI